MIGEKYKMSIEKGIEQYKVNSFEIQSKKLFSGMIQQDQLVGDLFSMNFERAKILVHDTHKHNVKGLPSLCFLIASRVNIEQPIDFKSEDSSIVLLRVIDSTPLPFNNEIEKIRIETAQRVSGENAQHWDSPEIMDKRTKMLLGHSAIECRIIGTFYLDNNDKNELSWKFGCDISNYYPNRGLKVYKPTGTALQLIVNYIDPINKEKQEDKYGKTDKVRIGRIRYASTDRKFQNIDDIPVYLQPVDLLAQKSALFGMTRTGKSNTTKIIAKSVYKLRAPSNEFTPLRIGQLIFDPNGEYANENVQDSSGKNDPNALRNIWAEIKAEKGKEVSTYGISAHPKDPDRNIMKINFFHNDYLQTGKELINILLANETAQYVRNFCQVEFDSNEMQNYASDTRLKRRVLAYRTLLNAAGLNSPTHIKVSTDKLFNADLLKMMANIELPRDIEKQSKIRNAAAVLQNTSPSWNALAEAFVGLHIFLGTEQYSTFNQTYIANSSSGESWADPAFRNILDMFNYPKMIRIIGKCNEQHSSSSSSDYAENIYTDLINGKLVIIDQSIGDPIFNQDVAKRVMWRIFNGNLEAFRNGQMPKDILIYVEEAHNLLPAGNDLDNKDVWVRTAKEGAKLQIGMIYATQEVSSIHKNILKNTSNWFISHLNNSDETKELCKFYDFSDFEASIRKAQDKGFLRIKTLSNYFVIPVQVDKFEIKN